MDKQVPLVNQLSSTQSPLTAMVAPAVPASPSWSIFFGLSVIIVLMGFFLIYLIAKNMKQEKVLETLKKKVETMPSSDNILGLITNEFEHPMMQNVHALIETRLNDYDRFVQQTYVRRDPIHQVQSRESPAENQIDADDLPPLIEEPQEEKSSVAQSADTNAPTSTQPFVRMSQSTMSRRAHNAPREQFGSHQRSAPLQSSSQSNQSTSSTNNPRSGGRSMLMEALPSLISMFTGSGSDSAASSSSDVTFPVIIGDIMTLMNNQQVRQRRREQMAPSSEVPSPLSESPSEVPPPSASNNRIRHDNSREE